MLQLLLKSLVGLDALISQVVKLGTLVNVLRVCIDVRRTHSSCCLLLVVTVGSNPVPPTRLDALVPAVGVCLPSIKSGVNALRGTACVRLGRLPDVSFGCHHAGTG